MKITPDSLISAYHIEIEYEGVKLRYVTSVDTETGECTQYKSPLEKSVDGEEFVMEALKLDPAKLHVYICKPS